jgi:hypothetical protein
VIDQLIELKIETREGLGMDISKKGTHRISNTIAQLEAFKMYFKNPLEAIQKIRCPIDNKSLLVSWTGQVYFCSLLQPVGNIRDFSIEEILLTKLAEERWKEIKGCKRNCNNKVNCFFTEEAVSHGE